MFFCFSHISYQYYKTGVKTEGILRQAADVDEVEYRVREYEQGSTFTFAVLQNLSSSYVSVACFHFVYIILCSSFTRVKPLEVLPYFRLFHANTMRFIVY